MIEQTEKKSRLVRWWIGTATSLMVLGFGGYLLLMRYALGHNPLGDGYWAITGLVLAFGAFRVGMQLWRRKYLFDDTTEGDNFKIKSTIPLLLISILLQGLGGCATPSIQEKWLILRSAERFQDIKTIVILAERNNSKKDIYDTTNAIIVGILRKDFNLQTIPVDTLSIIATYNADSIIKSHNADAVLYYSIGGLVNLVS
ncbi:MAG TPA: hypothetical protein VMF29_09360, partial [Candidatus Edwardsbacteria bacterium]|nr:hypothetical protein [Candidatus Edwardsbacteria bacterium]